MLDPTRRMQDRSASVSADKISALIEAGNELASQHSLERLFPSILELALKAVNAERGVLLAFEGESLDVKGVIGRQFPDQPGGP